MTTPNLGLGLSPGSERFDITLSKINDNFSKLDQAIGVTSGSGHQHPELSTDEEFAALKSEVEVALMMTPGVFL